MSTWSASNKKRSTKIFQPMNGMKPKLKSRKLMIEDSKTWTQRERREGKLGGSSKRKKEKIGELRGKGYLSREKMRGWRDKSNCHIRSNIERNRS